MEGKHGTYAREVATGIWGGDLSSAQGFRQYNHISISKARREAFGSAPVLYCRRVSAGWVMYSYVHICPRCKFWSLKIVHLDFIELNQSCARETGYFLM